MNVLEVRNILIVGSRSMVAKRLRRRLEARFRVTTAGRDDSADVRFDLTALFVPPPDLGTADVLIQCAGAFGGDEGGDAAMNELVNAVGSLRVMELARAARCRHVIAISSISIYEHPDNQYFGSYGLSKKHGHENLQWSCRKHGIAYTALLAAQLYDEYGEARRHQPLFYRIVDCVRAGDEVVLFGKESPRRNYVFVDDVAAVVEGVIDKAVCGTYPVMAAESPTLVEVAETAFRVFGRPARIRRLTDKPDPPTVYLPDDRRIYDCVNWHGTTSLEAGLALVRDHMPN